jgi:4-hydroxybenzoate polyprenyltransferase
MWPKLGLGAPPGRGGEVTAPHAPAREPQTFAGPSRLARYASLVKLPHTVFALPFALVGVVLASYAHAVTLRQVGWVVLAFTAARFAAMAFNRVADRDVDAANPRTRSREIPSGLLGVREAQALVFAAALVFVGAAWALNPLCGWLSPAALLWVLGYSYAKRVTRWSHLVLGLGLGIAPVGGYLAVAGRWSEPWWMLCAPVARGGHLGGRVRHLLRAAGRAVRPRARAALGAGGVRQAGAIRVAPRAAPRHRALLAAWRRPCRGRGRGPAVAVAAALLLWEHRLVRPGDPVAARRGVLHDERGDQHRVLRVRCSSAGAPGARRPGEAV